MGTKIVIRKICVKIATFSKNKSWFQKEKFTQAEIDTSFGTHRIKNKTISEKYQNDLKFLPIVRTRSTNIP